jgi:hypothetical protein
MTLVKLQDDLYIPENFAERHGYFADPEGEKEYTGITTILQVMAKPALIQWAANEAVKKFGWRDPKYTSAEERANALHEGRMHEFNDDTEFAEFLEEARTAHMKKKEAAGEHGTDTHSLTEQYIREIIDKNGGRPSSILQTNQYESIEKFIRWAIENVDRFLYTERPVHSRTLFLAGTIDFGAVMKDGKRRVGDLKTGSGIYYEAILQTEFYQMLAEEEGDEKYNGSVIVNLKKDGTFQTQERVRSQIDADAALGLLAAYRGKATFTKPKK